MNLQIVTAFLELLFVFVVLAALCNQRGRVGAAPLAMAFAAAAFFGILLSAAEVYIPLAGNWEVSLSHVVINLPLLTAFLMVYITMGALNAQRLLLGIMTAFLLFIYFIMMIRLQCSWITDGALRDVAMILLQNGAAAVNLNAVANLITYLTVPVFFSGLPRRMGRTLRIVAALALALCAGALPEAALLLINRGIAFFPWRDLVTLLALTPVMGFILSFYLALLEREVSDSGGALDFIFAFFGSYGRVKELEDDLNSWADRYHLVLRHTAEVVVMCDETGVIRDANIAACKAFAVRDAEGLAGRNLFKMIRSEGGEEIDWRAAVRAPLHFNGLIGAPGAEKTLSASLSPIHLKKQLLLVLVGRDITEEIRLEKEKQELSEQLMHSQRMESLGVLAGGVAHDFNNCIHAIMGHADVAEMLCGGDPEKVEGHLKKIISIAEKAGRLTSQLLGFARKGKYHVVDIDLGELLEECTGLLDPYRKQGVEFRCAWENGPLVIRGDLVQMQQVVLNLLINALDATAENDGERIITLQAGPASEAPLRFAPPAEHAGAGEDDYFFFSVGDNGIGMDEETKKKIFEPFFTTKPVGAGTGMGLAMVYGTVHHHRGWIQLSSTPGKGTVFSLFFPAKGA